MYNIATYNFYQRLASIYRLEACFWREAYPSSTLAGSTRIASAYLLLTRRADLRQVDWQEEVVQHITLGFPARTCILQVLVEVVTTGS